MRNDEPSQIPQATSRPTPGASQASRLKFAQRADRVPLPISPRPQKTKPATLGLPAGPRDTGAEALPSHAIRNKPIQDEDKPIQTRSSDQRHNPLKTNADRLKVGWLPASIHPGLTEGEQDQAAIKHEKWVDTLPEDKHRVQGLRQRRGSFREGSDV
jgi:hypothetical protein